MRRLLLALLLVTGCRTAGVVPAPATDFGPNVRVVAERLARSDPLDESVTIRLASIDSLNLFGRSAEQDGSYWIELSDVISDEFQAEILVHEWAHCRAKHKLPPGEDHHGETWGIEYSIAFRVSRGTPFSTLLLPILLP